MHPHDIPESSLPWSPEAEASVLGSLFHDAAAWDAIGDVLEAKHFFDPRHGRVYTAVSAMIVAGRPVDIITVYERLQTDGTGDGIDLPMLNDLSQRVYSARNARHYADIVAERALSRWMVEAADEVKTIAVTPGLPVVDRLEQAQAKLQALQIHRGRQMPVAAADLATRMVERVNALGTGAVQPGIPTGIGSIDKRLSGGLRPGKQMVLAARPSVGKSSLALQICINLAMDGHGAAFFSMEMPYDEQMDRATSNVGAILLDSLLTGRLSNEEWSRLPEAADTLRQLPLYFDEQPALTLSDITAKARALVRQHGIKLLVVDYLQLCGGRSDQSPREVVMEISRGLKNLAKQLGITIIALSQIGREADKRISGKPQLNDLKESGAIEEDADVVMLMSIDSVLGQGSKLIELDFAKNRQGRVGSVGLDFDGGYQRWKASSEPLGQRRGSARTTYTEDV